MKILGIETSCDETSIAIVEAGSDSIKVRKHATASQALLHERYGGVVPEVAARKHTEVIVPLLETEMGKRALRSVDVIAVTAGPGLVTSLMVGVQTAKSIAMMLQKPLVGVDHLEAHIYANWLTHKVLYKRHKYFPALVLIVSGGHTQFILMRDHGTYELLGTTLDDAAGEAFDKVAKVLELGYPGGPRIAKLAEQGDPNAIDFPRPLINEPGYSVSFSGLKTAVLYYLEKKKTVRRSELPDIAASFQQAVVDLLCSKASRAVEEFAPASIMLVGGVSANTRLRDEFQIMSKQYGLPLFIPELQYTGDNAAMIAAAGYYHRKRAKKTAWKTLAFDARLKFIQ